MGKVKLISIDYFKQNTVVEYNVDDDKIVPLIFKSQTVYLQQTLGANFLNHIYEQVRNNTLTPIEEELIRDYIQNMLVEYTLYLLIPAINYNLTNKSVGQKSGDNETPSSLGDIKYLRNEVLNMAQFYDTRVVEFLKDNRTDFPLWKCGSDNNINPSKNTYFSGVYIRRKGCGYDCSDEELNE